jgi:hypothetical protein
MKKIFDRSKDGARAVVFEKTDRLTSNLTEEESLYLEEIINEEIKSYLDSGYYLDNDYVITLRNLLSKFNLRESYPYDRWYKEESEE